MCLVTEGGTCSFDLNETKTSGTFNTVEPKDPPVDRGKGAYQYLAAAFLIETIVWGIATSFGVIFNFYQQDARSPLPRGSKQTQVILTLVGTLNTGVIASGAPILSFWIAKKPGMRLQLMISGLLTCGMSLFLSSYSTCAVHILMSQGIGYGIGGCALYYSALSYLPEWFEKKQGLANGIVFAGTGVGGLIFPVLSNSLLSKYGAATALKIIAAIFTTTTMAAVVFIRPRILNKESSQVNSKKSVSKCPKQDLATSRNFFYDFFRCLTGIFCVFLFSNTFQSTAFYLPGLYLPSYTHCLGLSPVLGSVLLSILNAGTIFSQLAAGALSDYYSSHLIGAIANFLGGASVLIFWGVLGHHNIVWLFVFSASYGSTAGAWTSLYFSILKDFVSERELVIAAYGLLSLTRGLGNIIGGRVSSALVSSNLPDHSRCGGFPTGAYSKLIWFIGLVLLINGFFGSGLWLHFRKAFKSRQAHESPKTVGKKDSL